MSTNTKTHILVLIRHITLGIFLNVMIAWLILNNLCSIKQPLAFVFLDIPLNTKTDLKQPISTYNIIIIV